MCLVHVEGRGESSWGCRGDIGFPIHVASSLVEYLPLSLASMTKPPNTTTSSKTCLRFDTFFTPTKQGSTRSQSNVLNRCPSREDKNNLKHFQFFFFVLNTKVYSFCFCLFSISQCPLPKKGLNNRKTFFFGETIYLVFDTSVGTLKT